MQRVCEPLPCPPSQLQVPPLTIPLCVHPLISSTHSKLYSTGRLDSWKLTAEDFHGIIATLHPYSTNLITESELHKVVNHVWTQIFERTGE